MAEVQEVMDEDQQDVEEKHENQVQEVVPEVLEAVDEVQENVVQVESMREIHETATDDDPEALVPVQEPLVEAVAPPQNPVVEVQGASNWNPLHWLTGAIHGQPEFPIEQDSPLLNLTPQIRGIIWRKIPVNEHSKLRLVCKLVNNDLENDVGIGIRLHAADVSFGYYLNARIKYLSGHDHQTPANVQRLENVIVQKLDIDGLHKIPLLNNQPILKNPAALKTLSICLDEEDGDGTKALQILDQCTGLSDFRISPRLPSKYTHFEIESISWCQSNWAALHEYNTTTARFLKDALRLLHPKPLKRLEISMKFDFVHSWNCLSSSPTKQLENALLKPFYLGMPVNNPRDPQQVFPTDLEMLTICMPQIRSTQLNYSGSQVSLFKSLMDAQTKLTHLKVRIGSIYWEYFVAVLNRCFNSLKCFDIDVGNWEQLVTIPPNPVPVPRSGIVSISTVMNAFANQTIDLPEADWFDWTQLFTANCNLETITIQMPFRAHISANKTKNFCLTFPNLKKLELQYVKLSQDEFRRILQDLPELKDVEILEWYSLQGCVPNDFLAYRQLLDHALECIRGALALERLENIKLWGDLISGCIYKHPENIRNTINHNNYSVKWSTSNYSEGFLTIDHEYDAKPDSCQYRSISKSPTLLITKVA